MTGNEIRQKFIEYFAAKGHTVVESSSLVPQDDPTLLFTNAGMVQFKKVFLGEEKRDYVRAVTSQRCVRAGGKHNDLENVGYTARHHTFFEMLGNFSFGDYFKEEAIRFAWEFLTEVLPIPREKLWVSVFQDDDEAFALWEKAEGLLPGRILRLGEKDNFWAMGDTGPCGPCSEIHIDQGVEAGCGKPDCQVGCDCDRFLELWNLVFMQFDRNEAGELIPLPKPSIDTGMGLERVSAVLQGKFTNYDSDIFSGITTKIAALSGHPYGKDRATTTAMRVIADHCRATTFLVADGVLPSNEGRGYVLRRVMRRAIRYGRTLGFDKPFLSAVTEEVVRQMSGAYPHLVGAVELLAQVVVHEEERFFETIDNGLVLVTDEIKRLQGAGESTIAGDFIFKLYDTFGFPVDIVRDIALENGLQIDEKGYAEAMAAQRQQSKRSWRGSENHASPDLLHFAEQLGATKFMGYEEERLTTKIGGLLNESGESVARVGVDEKVMVLTAATPFYAEGGGQVGDQGEIRGPAGTARVENTSRYGAGLVLHQAMVTSGSLAVGESVELAVDSDRRRSIARNHSATHLLQAVLRETLGGHVNQSGSLVEEERLRFDFTHFSPLSATELQTIERRVNEEIRRNTRRQTEILTLAEAQKSGATALFGEKYGETVRVVSFADRSRELCGGIHVDAAGEIGLFKILSETGIAAGVRRIVALTGQSAFQQFQALEESRQELAAFLKTTPEELAVKLKGIVARQKELEKEVSQLTAQLTLSRLDSLLEGAVTIEGVKLVVAQVALDSAKTLREVGDRLKEKLGSGVIVLGGSLNDKVALLAMVSGDLTQKCHAGNIIKQIAAKVGGSGGGRPDMAQAGGSMVDKLPEALASVAEVVAAQLHA